MMAAFIIAIKGTIKQAVMLGLAATLSHTAVVWLIALGGMYISKAFTAQAVEPWLQFVSAIIILGTAFWMFWRTWQGEQNWLAQTHHDHNHEHHHHHDHDDHHHDHDDDHHHHHHEHEHNHDHAALAGLTEGSKEYQDAHERAHATDIQRRFAGKEVTNGQILLFGLTGGLIPCPAAHYGAADLHPAQSLHAGRDHGAVLQPRAGANAGNGGRGSGNQRAAGGQTLERI